MSIPECFRLFELPETSSLDEIKKKYKFLALQYHPDRNSSPDAQEIFIKITDAYNELQKFKTSVPTLNPGFVHFYVNPYNTSTTTFSFTWG